MSGRVADALRDLMRAQRELDECREACDYDAGYWCSRQATDVEEAEEAFVRAIAQAVARALHPDGENEPSQARDVL